MQADVRFVGPIPRIYHDCLGPILFRDFAEVIAERVRVADRDILETAAGTGIVTRAVAAALPDSRIMATDLNPGMLEIAREGSVPANVTWGLADAQSLAFPDQSFDLVICTFGLMFMPDRVAAFREARRVLRPGGRFLFTVWDRLEENAVTQVVSEALAAVFPDNPPPFIERVPFGYFDPEQIVRDARAGGFPEIGLDVVRREGDVASADIAAKAICQGTPARGEIEERAPGSLLETTERVTLALRDRFGPGMFRTSTQALVGTAR